MRLRTACWSEVTTCMSTPSCSPIMPRGIVDAARGRRGRIAGRQRMQHRAALARVPAAGRFEHAMHVAVAHRLAAQRDVGVVDARAEPAAGHVDDDGLDLHPGHALGGIDREPDRLLGRLEVDDRAALHAARALVADADDAGAMRAAAQRLASVDRRQPGDQADDLAGADVEHRQHRRSCAARAASDAASGSPAGSRRLPLACSGLLP